MLVVDVDGKIPVVLDLKILRCTGIDEVAHTGKGPVGVDSLALAEGDGVGKLLGQVAQAVPEDVIYLTVDMGRVPGGGDDDLVTLLIFFQIAQFCLIFTAALCQNFTGGITDL